MRSKLSERYSSPALILGAIAIAVMIGFRQNIGSDWNAYVAMYKLAGYKSFGQLISFGDPAYMGLNWVAQELGYPFWFVNLVCGSVFAWGLYRLAAVQPDPWGAMIIALPYLVIVVAMGYARQGVAIGVLMAGLARFSRGSSIVSFIGYVAAASLFHRTAVVALPLAVAGTSKGRVANLAISLAAVILLFDYMLGNHVDRFINAYIRVEWNSQGAAIRTWMSVTPAVIYFLFRNKLFFTEEERAIWRNFSLAAFVCLFLLLIVPSSTVVDRLALYILPLQIAVLPRLGIILRSPLGGRLILVFYSFLVMFVWLNFAANSGDWVPYRYYSPFGD
jgi:hypothetical protein